MLPDDSLFDDQAQPAPRTAALPAARRAFPVSCRKREKEAENGSKPAVLSRRGLLLLAGAAATIAGFGAWMLLRTAETGTQKTAVATVVPVPEFSGPPDPARDIYFNEWPPTEAFPRPSLPRVIADTEISPPSTEAPVAPAEPANDDGVFDPAIDSPVTAPPNTASLPPPPSSEPATPSPAKPPGELEALYLAAMQRAVTAVKADELPVWNDEMERVKSGAPLPPPDDSMPAELRRLQSIYRRELAKRHQL